MARTDVETKVVNGMVFELYSSDAWNASDAKIHDFNFYGDFDVTPVGEGFIYTATSMRYGQNPPIWYLEPGKPSFFFTGERVEIYQVGLFS